MKRMRLTPVKLSEIPFERRMAAARVEARNAVTDTERGEILMAAMFPSDKVFWVKADEAEPLRAAA